MKKILGLLLATALTLMWLSSPVKSFAKDTKQKTEISSIVANGQETTINTVDVVSVDQMVAEEMIFAERRRSKRITTEYAEVPGDHPVKTSRDVNHPPLLE